MDESGVGSTRLLEVRPKRSNSSFGQVSFRQNPRMDSGIGKTESFVVQSIQIRNPHSEVRARSLSLSNAPQRKKDDPRKLPKRQDRHG
jgi:hypothetical protein